MNGRLHFQARRVLRELNFRDQFTVITDGRDKGVLGDAYFKVNKSTRLFMNYGLDTDYAVFRPTFKTARRFASAWPGATEWAREHIPVATLCLAGLCLWGMLAVEDQSIHLLKAQTAPAAKSDSSSEPQSASQAPFHLHAFHLKTVGLDL